MNNETKQKCVMMRIQYEGYREFPYEDNGDLSVGFGRNLTKRGISIQEATGMLKNDIDYFSLQLPLYISFFDALSEPFQIVLMNLAFTVGVKGLLKFEKLLEAIKDNNIEEAVKQLVDSKWSSQVGRNQVNDLVNIIQSTHI
jgi:lysozyme